MSRPKGSKNKFPYPYKRHANFLVYGEHGRNYPLELAAFKRMHDRVRDGKVASISWPRTAVGFAAFHRHIGDCPPQLIKPSIGRINHARGYARGNVRWEEHIINSVKRRGTKFQFEAGDLPHLTQGTVR